VKPSAKTAKPFSFLLERRTRQPPLLFMDVNLGPGRTGRIGIHEGDDPRLLARNFATTYQLDERLTARLEDLIRQHMESMIPGARFAARPVRAEQAIASAAAYAAAQDGDYPYNEDGDYMQPTGPITSNDPLYAELAGRAGGDDYNIHLRSVDDF